MNWNGSAHFFRTHSFWSFYGKIISLATLDADDTDEDDDEDVARSWYFGNNKVVLTINYAERDINYLI